MGKAYYFIKVVLILERISSAGRDGLGNKEPDKTSSRFVRAVD